MDDVLLMSRDKRDLKRAINSLDAYMVETLGLSLKPWKVAKLTETELLDLAGFRGHTGHVTLRRRLFRSVRRAFTRFSKTKTLTLARRVCSYFGWVKHCDSLRYRIAANVPLVVRFAKKMVSKNGRRYVCTPAAQPL